MGVHPEPALCADDVSRLVPNGSTCQNDNTAAGAARIPSNHRGLRQGLLAALVAGLALGVALPAATSQAGPGLPASKFRTDQRTVDQPAEWGGIRLRQDEPAAKAVSDNDPATPPEPKPDAQVLRFGDMNVPRPLAETIVRASEATGVDPVYMMALADKESSFDTDVRSSASSAQGLFQFVTGTWLEMIRDYGAKHGLAAEAAAVKGRSGSLTVTDEAMRKRVLALRNDPYLSGLMAGELIKRDRARIESRIGRELKTTELYIAHFLGTASAGRFLSLSAEAPDKNAQKTFGRAARANRSIFTQKDGAKRRSLSVSEVHERLDGMIDRRMSRYQAIAALASPSDEEAFDEEHWEGPLLDARLRLGQEADPALTVPTVQ